MDLPRRPPSRPWRGILGVALALSLLVVPVIPGAAGGATGVSSGAAPLQGPRPAAVGPFPYSVGLGYDGPNASGADVVVANITIPSDTSPYFLGNFTLGLQIADTACTVTTAAVNVDNNTFDFTDIFANGVTTIEQGWPPVTLSEATTYQLAITFFSGTLTAEIFDASTGGFYHPGAIPMAEATYADASATSLVLGPQPCGGAMIPWSTNLTTLFSPAPPYTPALDYEFQREAFGTSAGGGLALAPNLWKGFRHNAPSGIDLDQAWATSAILSEISATPAVSLAVKSRPPAAVDVGNNFSLTVLGTSRSKAPPFAMDTAIEVAGTADTISTGFLTCTSANGTVHVYNAGTSGFPGEYGYTSNISSDDLAWSGMDDPPAGTTLDLSCTTADVTTPGTITVYGLAFDGLFSGNPTYTYIDSNSSGARDIFGMSAWSAQVQVNPQMLLQIGVTPTVVVPGETVWANATESGGTAPVSTSWYINGTLQSCTTVSCQFKWAGPGNYSIWAATSDGTGARVVSLHQNVTVDPTLTSAVTPAPTGVGSAGKPLFFRATGFGGTDGYTYAFWTNASGTPVQKGPNADANLSFAHPGAYQVWAVVNDSHGDVAKSANSTVTIYPDIGLTLSPLVATNEAGLGPTNYTATVTGAIGAIAYTWWTSGLSTSGTCAANCSVLPSGNSTFQVWYDVTDTTGRTVASVHANLTVLPHLAFASWSGSSQGDQGGNATVTVHFTGGRAPVAYLWSVNGKPTGTCAASSSCSVILPAGPGAAVTVNATDVLGGRAVAPAWNITAVPDLKVSLLPAPTATAEVGVPFTLTASATNGTGGDRYAFYSGPNPITRLGVGSKDTGTFTLNLSGKIQVWALVNDSSGFQVASPHTNVTVLPALKVVIAPAHPGPISLGASLFLTATSTGGLGPVAYCWAVSGVPVTPCNGSAAFNDTPASLGASNVTVGATDSLGGTAASVPVNVTVVATRYGGVTFVVAPGEAGTISLAGKTVGTGTFHSILLGSYTMSASAAPGFVFTGWESSAPSALVVTSTSSAATDLTVSGNGTITANFVGIHPLTVEVGITPVGAGSVILNGTEIGATTNITLRAGLYPIVAVPGTGETFTAWNTTTGVSVTTGGSSGQLNVSAAGSVTAVFSGGTKPTEYQIVFDVSPSGSGGGFVLLGITYSAGAVVEVAPGSYSFSFQPVSGESFQGWVVTGSGAVVASSTAPSTTLTVSGPATVTAKVTTSSGATGFAGLSNLDLAILGILAIGVVVIVAIGLRRRNADSDSRKEPYTREDREGDSP